MRIWEALQYVDEVVELGGAIGEYGGTKDESRLADQVTGIALDIVRQRLGTDPSTKVDEDKLRRGVVLVIEAIEPAFD